MSGPNNTDQENSGETDGEDQRGFAERMAAKHDADRERRNEPMDLENADATRTANQLRVVETYEECLERGLTEFADRLQNAETKSKQRTYASIIRGTEYQASTGELDENASQVRARYRDDDE